MLAKFAITQIILYPNACPLTLAALHVMPALPFRIALVQLVKLPMPQTPHVLRAMQTQSRVLTRQRVSPVLRAPSLHL
jgi:hypothetical protein